MGWVWLFAIGLGAFGLLWLTGLPRSLAPLAAAALLVGAAGYALQQNAALTGSPVNPEVRRIEVDPGMVAFREAIMPTAPSDTAILGAADARLRNGDTAGAAQILLDAVDRRPTNVALWTGLGTALAAHDKGHVSPAAEQAFGRAIQLGPKQPGPHFFLGLASLQGGDLAGARRSWLEALALAPRDAPYRILIAERLVMVDRFLAMQADPASPVR
jgi:hypothetical protein